MRNVVFWIASLLLIIAVVLIVFTLVGWFRLTAVAFGESVHHLFSWSGAVFIGVFLPLYSVLIRRFPNWRKKLGTVHILGNLMAFTAISIHFSHQLTRPPQAYPNLGTGVALISALTILVITGFVTKFRLAKNVKPWHWIHRATIIAFYLVVILHILHGIGTI